jgi:hypothetical protein
MPETRTGRCHCGAIVFEVALTEACPALFKCNCSLCSRKSATMISVPKESLRVVKGEGQLSLYQWNTRVAKHYFCRICGIYTHHQRRMDPGQIGFNAACLDGIDVMALVDPVWLDGARLSLVGDAGS